MSKLTDKLVQAAAKAFKEQRFKYPNDIPAAFNNALVEMSQEIQLMEEALGKSMWFRCNICGRWTSPFDSHVGYNCVGCCRKERPNTKVTMLQHEVILEVADRLWAKEDKPVRDAAGQLIPWEEQDGKG